MLGVRVRFNTYVASKWSAVDMMNARIPMLLGV